MDRADVRGFKQNIQRLAGFPLLVAIRRKQGNIEHGFNDAERFADCLEGIVRGVADAYQSLVGEIAIHGPLVFAGVGSYRCQSRPIGAIIFREFDQDIFYLITRPKYFLHGILHPAFTAYGREQYKTALTALRNAVAQYAIVTPVGHPNVASGFIYKHRAGRVVTVGGWWIGSGAGGKVGLPPDIICVGTIWQIRGIIKDHNPVTTFLNDVNSTRVIAGYKTQAGKSIARDISSIGCKIRLTQHAVSGSAICFVGSIVESGHTAIAGFADPKSAVFIYKNTVRAGHAGGGQSAATSIKIWLSKHAVRRSAVGFISCIVVTRDTVRVKFGYPKRSVVIDIDTDRAAHGTLRGDRSLAHKIRLTEHAVRVCAGGFIGRVVKAQHPVVGKIANPHATCIINVHADWVIHLGSGDAGSTCFKIGLSKDRFGGRAGQQGSFTGPAQYAVVGAIHDKYLP